MSSETIQEGLFRDPLGIRLRQAREAAGMSVESVAKQLKLPLAIVRAMELEDWARLGAPIYVRSYLGSYLRLVGLPAELVEQVATGSDAPALVAMGSASRVQHAVSRSMRNLGYLAMTALLVVPVFLVARNYQAGAKPELLTLETTPPALTASAAASASVPQPPSGPHQAPASPTVESSAVVSGLPASDAVASPAAADLAVAPAVPSVEEAGSGPSPVMASMAPFAQPSEVAQGPLVLRFAAESWVDIVDPQGGRIERGLVEAGAERRYAAGQVARITLGRADAVDVSFAGKAVDLAPFRAANVARFAVSSEGEPTAAGN
jgi:cytoskeleton protein RodZ